MKTSDIHQLLHGYRRGHELLAASVELPRHDLNLITRLSDLSGSLPANLTLRPYLTIYPLEETDYFAIGRTVLDDSAPRPGCVRTHTLLVPISVWCTMSQPDRVGNLLTRISNAPIDSYRTPLLLPKRAGERTSNFLHEFRLRAIDFARRYFIEGITPLVWPTDHDPSEFLWALVNALWPRLRGSFSACSMTLQPRELEQKPFDLMFVPSRLRARFNKFDDAHFVRSAMESDPSRESDHYLEAISKWTDGMLSGTPSIGIETPYSDLVGFLPSDPTSLRLLFRLEQFSAKPDETPWAAIGRLDILDTLSPDPKQATAQKTRFARSALEAASQIIDFADTASYLRALAERLARPSFREAAHSISSSVVEAGAKLTAEAPQEALALLTPQPITDECYPVLFHQGVMNGLRDIGSRNPGVLFSILQECGIATYIIANDPLIALFSARGVLDRGGPPEVRSLLQWIDAVVDVDCRAALRKLLVPQLRTFTALEPILENLITDMPADSLIEVLSASFEPLPSDFENVSGRIIADVIAPKYPFEVREWAHSLATLTDDVENLVACTFPLSSDGLHELLASEQIPPDHSASVLASYVARQKRHLPIWLINLAVDDDRVMSTLLRFTDFPNSRVSDAIERLVVEAPRLPLARIPHISKKLEEIRGNWIFESLLSATFRSVIFEYARGALGLEIATSWTTSDLGGEWLASIRTPALSELVQLASDGDEERCGRLWIWLSQAPDSLYSMHSDFVGRVADLLLLPGIAEDADAVAAVAETTRRYCISTPNSSSWLQLSTAVLRFALQHRRNPTSRLVLVTFLPIHRALDEGKASDFFRTYFYFFDWDRSKQLRHEVVDAFVNSEWPPGDLILAAREPWLVEKLVLRLRRRYTSGELYLNAALKDLQQRESAEAQEVLNILLATISDPTRYGEWD